jgi:hypothetical protein
MAIPDDAPDLPSGSVDQGVRDINFAACKSVSIFEDLFNTEFKKVRFARYIEENNSGTFNSVQSGNLELSFITLGDRTPSTPQITDAVVDVVGHELAHSYQKSMHPGLLKSQTPRARALIEGLADIYGTYVELDFNQNFDWELGELGRNLMTRVDWDPGAGPYVQAEAVGHWFYLCHTGDSPTPGPTVHQFDSDILRKIIDDAFLFMHGELSIPKFAQFTVIEATETFDLCSEDIKFVESIENAWGIVGVFNNFPAHPSPVINRTILVNGPVTNLKLSTVLSDNNITFDDTQNSPVDANPNFKNDLTGFTFHVNTNLNIDIPMIFKGCTFVVDEGKRININANTIFQQDFTSVCGFNFLKSMIKEKQGTKWSGIHVNDDYELSLFSTIVEGSEGAAVVGTENSTITSYLSEFNACGIGISLEGNSISNSFIGYTQFNGVLADENQDGIPERVGAGISLSDTSIPKTNIIDLRNNVFVNLDTGIRGFGAEVNVFESQFNNCYGSISLDSCSLSSIGSNYFSLNKIGIKLKDSDNCGVIFNEMQSNINGPHSEGILLDNCQYFGSARNLINASTGIIGKNSHSAQVFNTTINSRNKESGLLWTDSNWLWLRNNKITGNYFGARFTNCKWSFAFENEFNAWGYGIALTGNSNNTYLYNNEITSEVISTIISNSPYNYFSCNSTNGKYGLWIDPNSDMQYINRNLFNDELVNLQVRSQIGPQPYRGNEFNGSGIANELLGPLVLDNQFKVATDGLPYTPMNHAGGSNWFDIDEDDGEDISCLGQIGPGWFNDDNPNLFTGDDPDWICRYLNRLNDSRSVDPNSYFINYYHLLNFFILHIDENDWPQCITTEINTNTACGIRELVNIEKLILSQNSLNLNQSVEEYFDGINDFVDSELSELSLDQIDTAYYMPILESYFEGGQEGQETNTSSSIEWIDPTINMVEEINCNEYIASIYKQILVFRLRTIKDDSFTAGDYREINKIANLCPHEYGSPVDWARAFLQGTEYDHFDLFEDCDETERGNERSTELTEISIYPNPSPGEFIFKLNSINTGNIRIFNQMGEIVKSTLIEDSDEQLINISDMNNGLYYVSFEGKNGFSTIKKLIKID